MDARFTDADVQSKFVELLPQMGKKLDLFMLYLYRAIILKFTSEDEFFLQYP